MFSAKYNALAGRVQSGNLASAYCPCGVEGPPCYEENTWQLCNGEGGMQSQAPPSDDKSTKDTAPVDAASLGLVIFVAAYLFRRFII